MDEFHCAMQPNNSGLPQSSPVSPILFSIYISRVFSAIEEAVPGVQALSFADDIGLTTTEGSVEQVCKRLQQADEAAERWGHHNAVQFDMDKTEALLFSRKKGRRLQQLVEKATVMLGGHTVEFSKEAVRWLGV